MKEKKEMREKEAPGIRLLKKGQKGIVRMVFSRMGIVMLLLLFNILLLFGVFYWFGEFLPHVYGGTAIFTVCMVIYLMNSRMDPTAKLTWLAVIMLLPAFGSLFYLFTRTDLGHRTMKKRLQKIYAESEKIPIPDKASNAFSAQVAGAAAMARYVSRQTGLPICRNEGVEYFKCGEEMFIRMLSVLEKAEKSIYLEYFIIDEGMMWGQILEILARKASEGIDVRVIYDGTCEFLLLPKGYPKKLRKLGIQCRVFAPATPFLSTHYNYRDHRKILTVDGKIGFTGGINLADEYINATSPFGYWKDTAVMLCGEAVKGLERMFLQMWNLEEKNIAYPPDEEKKECFAGEAGFVLPYYEDPLDDEHIGRQVYMDILSRAERYVYIMTPYLILDGELENALTYAAKRGVEVTLVLPGIPDKKIPYALAKSHYFALVSAGVKICEYTPGFVHAKVVIADDREAVVGTINFDYRSLYHHFECAVYLNGTPCISDMVSDFEETVKKSRVVTAQSIKSEKAFYKVIGYLMKIMAPLM